VGIFDPATDAFSTVDISTTKSTDKYLGGVLLPSGEAVFVPFSADNAVIFDPTEARFTPVYLSATTSTAGKYAGGVLLPSGKVAFVPFNMPEIAGSEINEGSVALLDPDTNPARISTVGISFTGRVQRSGGGAYAGGVLLPVALNPKL